MNAGVEFHYELTGTGWSECRVAIGDTWCQVTASYLSDALGDLAGVVEDVLRWPGVDARVVFVEEPGEYRWRFVASGNDGVRVKVIEFPDWGATADEAGRVILDAECGRQAIGKAVAAELRRLLAVHGLDGYREKWVNYDFPSARLAAIEELLAGRGGSAP
jgi:hypothetical protein